MTDSNHHLDVTATQAIISAGRSATLRNVCYGAGAVILGSGLAIAATVWANRSGNSLAEIEAVLARTTIKTESTVSGNVTMTDGIVRLADGATVAVTGSVPLTGLPQQQSGVGAMFGPQGKGVDAIKREVVVFSSNQTVSTGWNFASATDKAPYKQFCYHDAFPGSTQVQQIFLFNKGRVVEENRQVVANFDELLAKCTWFKPGDV